MYCKVLNMRYLYILLRYRAPHYVLRYEADVDGALKMFVDGLLVFSPGAGKRAAGAVGKIRSQRRFCPARTCMARPNALATRQRQYVQAVATHGKQSRASYHVREAATQARQRCFRGQRYHGLTERLP